MAVCLAMTEMLIGMLRPIRTKWGDKLGWALLALAALSGSLTLYWGSFVDEADNLVVGSLLSRGYVLYRDIFSHHFPFPYYWTALVVSLFGESILFARLLVWLFQIGTFAIVMVFSRHSLIFGLTALVWSLLRPFYRGQMVLYYSFSAAALVVVFALTLGLLREEQLRAKQIHSLLIGLFAAIAILSDPLSVYATLVAIGLLFSKDWRLGTVALMSTIGAVLSLAGYLQATSGLGAFFRDVIEFNLNTYAPYTNDNYANPVRWQELWQMTSTGLEIIKPVWFNFDPFKPITWQYAQFDQWLFTGFLYRLATIAAVIWFALRRQFRSAVFVYLFAAATLVISPWDFRSQSFVLIALLSVAALVTRDWWPAPQKGGSHQLQFWLRLLIGLALTWLSYRILDYWYVNRESLSYEINFAGYESEGDQLRQLTCGQPDVHLAHYPGGIYYHWFTGMPPVSRYIFMWPWVADVGLNDVIVTLKQDKYLAIVVRQEEKIWGLYDTREYLRPLDEYLNANYVQAGQGLYSSPELAARCANH